MKYQIDKNQLDDFIKRVTRRRILIFMLKTLTILAILGYLVYNPTKNDFPILFFVFAITIVTIIFLIASHMKNARLRKQSNGEYLIDSCTLKHRIDSISTKEFKFDEIAIINQKSYGTILIQGTGWTKFNYLRPLSRRHPRRNYNIDDPDVIFIPTITSNYDELITMIKDAARKAMKL